MNSGHSHVYLTYRRFGVLHYSFSATNSSIPNCTLLSATVIYNLYFETKLVEFDGKYLTLWPNIDVPNHGKHYNNCRHNQKIIASLKVTCP